MFTMKTIRSIIFALIVMEGVEAFVVNPRATTKGSGISTPLISYTLNTPNKFELQMARNDDEDIEVNVNIIDNVDPVTLTAIGFGAIFMNFFVFGNMGDGGIGGLVARIINTFN